MRKNYKHCNSYTGTIHGKYGNYSTLSLAQSACDSDSNCRGVYDDVCENTGPFHLCPISADLEESPSNCVYEKVLTAGI